MSTAPDIAQRTAASSIDVSFADCWITPAAQAAAGSGCWRPAG